MIFQIVHTDLGFAVKRRLRFIRTGVRAKPLHLGRSTVVVDILNNTVVSEGRIVREIRISGEYEISGKELVIIQMVNGAELCGRNVGFDRAILPNHRGTAVYN